MPGEQARQHIFMKIRLPETKKGMERTSLESNTSGSGALLGPLQNGCPSLVTASINPGVDIDDKTTGEVMGDTRDI